LRLDLEQSRQRLPVALDTLRSLAVALIFVVQLPVERLQRLSVALVLFAPKSVD
jgi:hypothetical protein